MAYVKLSPTELLHGGLAGTTIQVRAIKRGGKHEWGMSEENAWHAHIEGVLGELALAKWQGVYWSLTTFAKRNDGDVGKDEVRTTHHENGRLIMHPEDSDDRKYWLVTGSMGEYQIRGWLYGRDGKQERWWADPAKNRRPAYWVPQEELNTDDVSDRG
jgi:hypothetical protein